MTSLSRPYVYAAIFVTAAAAVLLLIVAGNTSPWEAWWPATCMPAHCFCEAVRSQLVRQPSNSISGLAFLTVGILVLGFPSAGQSVVREFPQVYVWLYALATLLIGAGTIFYHASLTFWGQAADVLGMYLIATFLVLYNAARVREVRPATAAVLYIAANAILLAGLIVVPAARRWVFAVLIVAALVLELAARRREPNIRDPKYFLAAVAVLAAGFLVWTLDITHRVCSPTSWLQGHAVWHVAGAASAWLVFRYYTSTTRG
jgi:hypothetical protein